MLSSKFGITLSPCFFLFSFLCTCFELARNSWFCLNCEILCSYLLTFVFFAITSCFNSSITRFISFFFTLYLAFSYLILLFLSLQFLLFFFQKVDIPFHVGNITINSSFPPSLFFLSSFGFLQFNFFCNPNGGCPSKFFIGVTSSVSICFVTAFTFLAASLNFL